MCCGAIFVVGWSRGSSPGSLPGGRRFESGPHYMVMVRQAFDLIASKWRKPSMVGPEFPEYLKDFESAPSATEPADCTHCGGTQFIEHGGSIPCPWCHPQGDASLRGSP